MDLPRKFLSAKGLLGIIYEQFKKITPPRELAPRANPISLTDCLMSAVAVFGLKFPSLLKFDEAKNVEKIKHNLKTLYHVQQAPSDTYMRERCDEADPREIRKIFKKILAKVQRGKELKAFEYLDGHYLIAGDGTGFFSSSTVHCKNCCVKHHRKCHVKLVLTLPDRGAMKKNTYYLVKSPEFSWQLYYINEENGMEPLILATVTGLSEILGDKEKKALSKEEKAQVTARLKAHYGEEHPEEEVTYYHNMFCTAIVHPEQKTVLPFAPEPIIKTDGLTKNDCERNASKRSYTDLRREHPHLKVLVVEDCLGSNVPHLSDLTALDMRYIIGAKQGDHKFLFNQVNQSVCTDYSHVTEDGTTHRYRYINGVQLNNSHPDFNVNFLEYWETDKKGKIQHFAWVTDLLITDENVYDIMRGGRTNWRIENNQFNTLKNQDYHFEHNFGHGYQNLSSVFGMLMMLAFFVDQVQELSCNLFKKARAELRSRTSLWDRIKGMFQELFIFSWEDVFNSIVYGHEAQLVPNTS